MAQRRLKHVLDELTPHTQSIGTLKLGDIAHEVHPSATPSRLPHSGEALLDIQDSFNLDNLHFMLQKFLLGQDIFLLSQPGLYARRLAMTFCSLINSEYEYIALHRDIGETELKQGREISAGGNLIYVDSSTVRAVKQGRILIIEGIEKAERGIMPVLNSLLEGREMNLDDGTHIIHSHRYSLLDTAGPTPSAKTFIPAHKNFRVIAIAAPVPPYPGYPLDPPFRSRFQALVSPCLPTDFSAQAPESSVDISCAISSVLAHLARLILTIHPALMHAPFVAWAMLSKQLEDADLEPLGSPHLTGDGDNLGLLGYRLASIERVDAQRVRITFEGIDSTSSVTVVVGAGPKPLLSFPFTDPGKLGFSATDRFMGLLTTMLQAHAIGWDISYVPPVLPSTASCSTSLLVQTFGTLLGYEVEDIHLYKELGGRELVMRRRILEGGATTWEPSPLVEGAWQGRLVHCSLSRLIQDREMELWGTKRIVTHASDEEKADGDLSVAHPSFRVISTASKSLPLKDWLADEHANMFLPVAAQPMGAAEERALLLQTGCPDATVQTLLAFAEKYRAGMTSDAVQKNRKLGTRALLRIARRVAGFPGDNNLRALLGRTILAEFLPTMEAMNLEELFQETGIKKRTPAFNPPPVVQEKVLCFPEPSDPYAVDGKPTLVPLFDGTRDPEGAASYVPHMDHFYDNSLQTGLMRDLAIDLELLGEHLVLLGNQSVQLLRRPREYIQLHRDTTVSQLMFQTVLEGGVIKYTDSPLLRAIALGRVIIIDEADKAAEHVVAIFRSLAGHGQLTLTDGRRVRRQRERDGDIVVHPSFRLILLANRPGYPFLGNHFLQVLGDNFSCHSVTNPDMLSERKLLSQLAPDLGEDLILRLVAAFQDLRHAYDSGTLTYPYSLRELINIVRHLEAYPDDSLETTIRNVFDFDVYKPDTIEKLASILDHHGLVVKNVGLDAARETSKKKVLDVQFEPQETKLSEPKFGKEDPDNEPHSGGNTWAGGTGGRDTAGLGGRGGYMRLFKGHDIKQIPDALKNDIPDHVKERAREMARQELARRLEELNMKAGEARGYGALLTAVDAHIAQLHDLLENLAAKEEERVWVKRQTDGELDDSRLTEGLTGEAAVYKRRGMEKPEMGRPQIKPKRIRFVFDISASMYRFQYDGRLKRSMETAVMLMETFERLTRKDKYVWDSGDEAEIPLVTADNPPTELHDRWKVVEKMETITQYTFAGDNTVDAIDKAVNEVAKFDADDWFVVTVTDANFSRYGITPEELQRVMTRHPKVHTALICIGEGAEALWLPKTLPGRSFRVSNTADIPAVLRSILSSMVDR
ncbi:AAA domain-containing protein [Amylocystis lapponica]|nr:AAA domain-containing protein [Amylocystis lapponica]